MTPNLPTVSILGIMQAEAGSRAQSVSTQGFDFLGWHFYVQQNGQLRCVPSEENYKAFRQKVKQIVNNCCNLSLVRF